jgi:hypothetical protein
VSDAVNSNVSALELISRAIEQKALPIEGDLIFKLQDRDGHFTESESAVHDYKDQYPFSNSDGYFGGILRLICAFHNSFGGLILFGVNDETRLAGRNKVVIDPEKINRKLRESLTNSVEVSFRSYETSVGRVDVLLVPKREIGVPPVRLVNDIGGYSSKKIFMRRGAEVLDASGSDLEFLYGARSNQIIESGEQQTSVDSSLPASPATLTEFVGRFRVMEDLMRWLTQSRDPRFFLWGAGGSGKSTIAYEFARIVASIGRRTHTKAGKAIDRVTYLTAKKIFLDPFSAKMEKFSGTDFDNAKELFRAILELSSWTDADLSSLTEEELIDELQELFDLETQLIVIDDIDTLVSSNEDLGMEQLFNVIARCSSGTKVLYTQRNLPSYARRAAVEVPGLEPEIEFVEFCKLCAQQFRVPNPTPDEQKKIGVLSELRPLAIETIIGLRRIAPSYEVALQRWKSDASQAREYLFQREYERLASQNRGRYFLAALAAFGKPQRLDTLQQILGFSDEQIQDAISETRDIFLRIEYGDADGVDQYSLGAATQSFILKVSAHLDRYPSIKARVQNFNAAALAVPPAVVVIVSRAERNIDQGQIESAITLLTNPALPPAIIEHPSVKAVLGIAYSKLPRPRISDARALFKEASALGNADYRMFLAWVDMEISAGSGGTLGIEVCRYVVGNPKFNLKTLATFYRKLAYLQVGRSLEVGAAAPDESAILWKEAVLNNTKACLLAAKGELNNASSFFDQFVNSLKKFTAYVLRSGAIDDFFEVVESIFEWEDDITDCLGEVSKSILQLGSKAGSNRAGQLRKHLSRLSGRFGQKGFCKADPVLRSEVLAKVRDLANALKS